MKRKLITLLGLVLLTMGTFAFGGSVVTPTKAGAVDGCCGQCDMRK